MAIVTVTPTGTIVGPLPDGYEITVYAEDGNTVLGVLHTPTLEGEFRFEVYGQRAGSWSARCGQQMWWGKIDNLPRVEPGDAYQVVLTFKDPFN